MRVLWLTQTPAGASELLNFRRPGCGWISSLQDRLTQDTSLQLGICFFHEHPDFKIQEDRVTYYPVDFKYSGTIGKIYQRLSTPLYDSNPKAVMQAIEDFKPDVIHLFGTETGMGEIIEKVDIPVLIHIQGLINPYAYAWYPKGVSKWDVLFYSSMKSVLFRTSLYFEHIFFKKRARREKDIIKNGKYFFGRTHWDRNIVNIYNSDSEYIHCEEMLRPTFYSKRWHKPVDNQELILVTTINPYPYKGLEIIYEAAKILTQNARFKFTWNIIGIGKDHEITKLTEKLTRGSFKNVHVNFLGPLTEDRMIDVLLDANIYIHPSHIDNSPNSICEAMLLGMPVIAGDVGGISTIVNHEVSGVLYNSHDPYDLVGRIIEYWQNPSQLLKIGESAKAQATKRHDPSSILETVISSYQQVIQKTKKIKLELTA